ncbi:helix-turn-helix domain-containing protein [Bacillus paralicheniformis]|uniref:helix-turn-helix domain-containing protein n=1 Tax=Bacillus paralicheniformis TaxID=1648923 RepID=UPI001CC371D5|nr:helix-turn-helix domain-containing protein [Bacillus paralicheniformis]UAY72831.1 helix-turn-helix domain-containing protein [Bacillus paralicheniformis]
MHTVTDVAELLKLSKCKSMHLPKSGDIPTVKIGGFIRINQEDLENFLKDGGVK